MKTKLILAFLFVAALAVCLALLRPSRTIGNSEPTQPSPAPLSEAVEPPPPPAPEPVPTAAASGQRTSFARQAASEPLPILTNRFERLAQVRKQFQALAKGDPTTALVAAKQLTNQVERETALLALVTDWTQGDLRPPRERALAISTYGLEAGLGFELAKNPELAVLWANELTEGQGRAALLGQAAVTLLGSDPAAAFALSQQVAPGERRQFYDTVFAGWAAKDTEAALDWAGQLPDAAERDAAVVAIRTVAPVGIGAALSVQDGYPVINDVLPGTPAEFSGQLHKGDRILALAQGDNAFVDTRNLSLQDVVQMVRGAPGSQLQLQIVPADAPPGSLPQTITIFRDQLKFKQ